MDIKIYKDDLKFKLRVTAIFIYDNCLFVDKYTEDSYILPGGYVEIGESSEDAILRELKEETGLDFNVISFAGVAENFYINSKGQKTHGIDFYYFVNLSDEQVNNLNMDYIESDKGRVIKHNFKWLNLNEINNYNVLPDIIKNILNENIKTFHYIINDNEN